MGTMNHTPVKQLTAVTSSTITVNTEAIHTPFSCITQPFYHAIHDADDKNLCFPKGDINVELFNRAVSGFLTIFDALGCPIITEIVRRDFRGKTNGLRNSSRRLRAQTLRELVRNEIKSPPRFWAASGIECLQWCQRILSFIEQLVQHLADDERMELKEACIRAYRDTLALRHPNVTKAIFERALQLVPPRKQFVSNLCQSEQEANDEQVALCLVGMKDFLKAVRPHINALQTLFEIEDIDDMRR